MGTWCEQFPFLSPGPIGKGFEMVFLSPVREGEGAGEEHWGGAVVPGAVFVITLFSDKIGPFGVNLICILVALYFVFSCGVYCGEDLIKMIRSMSGAKKS